MLLEMHVHTSRYSACSIIDPETLIRQVKSKGLDGAILTEHHYMWNDEEIAELRKSSEVDDNFLILAAQEIETDIGHVLVYGADRTIEEAIALKELRKRFPQAALVWAHPFRNGAIPDKKALLNPLLDGIEVFSNNQTVKENALGLRSWHRYKFNAIAGSDTHARESAGIFPTLFDHPVTTIGEVAEEIKKTRCRPLVKEIPNSGISFTVE